MTQDPTSVSPLTVGDILESVGFLAIPLGLLLPIFVVGGILVIALAAGPASMHAQMQSGILEPENANEARLNRLQPPDQVMDAVGVEPGMVVAEIGAGRGRYVVQLAVRVGEQGKVYAEDIDGAALQHCENRCRRWGLENVETILGDVIDPKLPEGELDLIFIISSYGHFSDPVALMRNARPALKPDGIGKMTIR